MAVERNLKTKRWEEIWEEEKRKVEGGGEGKWLERGASKIV